MKPDEDLVSWSSVKIDRTVLERFRRSHLVSLVLGGKIETHAEILVVTKWSLFCNIVEYDNWPRHLNFLLILNMPSIIPLMILRK